MFLMYKCYTASTRPCEASMVVVSILTLCVIPRLVKDMVAMSSDTFASEHGWESQTLRHHVLGDLFVSAFWLSNNELSDLYND